MEYTTIANLKAYLGISDTSSDALLTNLIKRCSQQFDKYLGRNLGSKAYTEYVTMDDDNLLIVANGPVNSVSSIKYDNASGSPIEYTRIDGNIIYLSNSVDGLVFVEYNAGYSSINDILDVEQACLEACNDLWNNTPSSGNEANIKSKQIETLSKTYFSKDEMAGGMAITFRDTLDNYKIFNPLIV